MTAETIFSAGPAARVEGLLSKSEQISLGVRLLLSLIAGGCLILSAGLQFLAPSQTDVAELIAGIAALLVAVPALSAAWQSLRYPDLHGITDLLIALGPGCGVGGGRPNDGGATPTGHDAWTHLGGALALGLAGGNPSAEPVDPDQDAPTTAERRGRRGDCAGLAHRRSDRLARGRSRSG